MELSIAEVAKLTGTTSRTLRHYAHVGLLAPSRVGAGGYRYYDEDALVRLQRILLLRHLGLGLPEIASVLARETSETDALAAHVRWLHAERERVTRQIAAIERTLESRRGGERVMAQDMFDGFDHTQYREEVTERWGAQAYERSDAWWRGLSADDKSAWHERSARLAADWVAVAESGEDPTGTRAHEVAARHVQWLRDVPGAPSGDGFAAYVRGLADMYVADPRFAANYVTSAGPEAGATFVRDALHAYADAHL